MNKSTYKKYLFEILTIALPLILGGIGHMLTGAVDVIVAGRYSVEALASISLGNAIIYTIMIVGIGFLGAISIILSNYRGEGKLTQNYFYSGIYMAIFFSIITSAVSFSFIPLIDKMGFEENIVPYIKDYIFLITLSLPGIFLFQAIKEFLQAHEIVNAPNYIILGGVLLNLLLNIWFVFGGWFIRPLGVVGLAYATIIVRYTALGALIIYARKYFKFSKQLTNDYAKQIIKIGFPIGLGLLIEFLAFNLITVLIGREGSVYVATHNIVLTLSEVAFTIPLALSFAIAIKVGFYNGANNLREIINYAKTGITACVGFMVLCSLMYLVFPKFCVRIFTQDINVISTALSVMIFIALYQVADGIQISVGGVLKGLKLTKEVTFCVFAGYWLVGMPLGIYFAIYKGMLLRGFWLGISISLFVIAFLETMILLKHLQYIRTLKYNKYQKE